LARKGVLGVRIAVFGESAHSGVAPAEGVDAGRMAARVIESLGWLNDTSQGTIVNLSVIETDASPAARGRVSWKIVLGGEIRYWRPEDQARLTEAVSLMTSAAMVCNPYIVRGKQVCGDFEIAFGGQPAIAMTAARKKWFEAIYQLSVALGEPVEPVASGFVADMNPTGGLEIIDSFGPVAEAIHTPAERTPYASLVGRVRLTALTLQATRGSAAP
jgi:acetylornithine deacetylase/succinyl-diaminopimelate desuccinylase-like protein